MNKIRNIYQTAFDKTREFRSIIFFLIITNVVFLLFGHWMIAKGLPGAVALREEILKTLPEAWYLKPLGGPLAPYLSLKIIYTFFFNLIVGAFLSTTLPGVIFFMPYLITVLRAWFVGVIFYGAMPTNLHFVIFYGTFILEFGGYVFSSAAGIDIGLAILNPAWKKKETRSASFMAALRDAKLLFVIAATLLFAAAVWEMSWLHFFGREEQPVITTPSKNIRFDI